ncbi:Hypothetical protein IALB_0423 [Ignavibacterium album JCM 16511]|uniref:Uncharacterized protein n=1 Tax=Ignavibacterium album (strain DSM 19864 / JCM 16511 / NBRC 101810 / Mat9-16) TaxID=945713 RepID=I0AGM8_IGNAJ|nr:Hypothetical protein IALB_0423 [Ignavibacterium album JCM 16511]
MRLTTTFVAAIKHGIKLTFISVTFYIYLGQNNICTPQTITPPPSINN